MTVRDIILASDIIVTIWEYDAKSNNLYELAANGISTDRGFELTTPTYELIDKYGDLIVDSIDIHDDRIRIIVQKRDYSDGYLM